MVTSPKHACHQDIAYKPSILLLVCASVSHFMKPVCVYEQRSCCLVVLSHVVQDYSGVQSVEPSAVCYRSVVCGVCQVIMSEDGVDLGYVPLFGNLT